MRVPLSLFAALFLALPAERKQGNPLDHLPPNFEVLTHFGERADISPDNLRVAFMAKSFGDAMVIELNTRAIRCLTCNVPAAVFLRVMHLVTGDYILIGPDHFENIRVSRTRDNELWFLSKERGSRPTKLGQKMSEGAAISKKSRTMRSRVSSRTVCIPRSKRTVNASSLAVPAAPEISTSGN